MNKHKLVDYLIERKEDKGVKNKKGIVISGSGEIFHNKVEGIVRRHISKLGDIDESAVKALVSDLVRSLSPGL